jgi:hypothetical protein
MDLVIKLPSDEHSLPYTPCRITTSAMDLLASASA